MKEWLRLKHCMYNTLQEVTQREDELGREHGSYLHLTLYPRKKQSSRYVFIWCGKWISYKKVERNIYFFSKFWFWNIHDLYFTFGWFEKDYCTITVFDFSLLDYEWWKISKGRFFTLFNFWFIFFLHFFDWRKKILWCALDILLPVKMIPEISNPITKLGSTVYKREVVFFFWIWKMSFQWTIFKVFILTVTQIWNW